MDSGLPAAHFVADVLHGLALDPLLHCSLHTNERNPLEMSPFSPVARNASPAMRRRARAAGDKPPGT